MTQEGDHGMFGGMNTEGAGWRSFVRKHGGAVAMVGLAAILVSGGAVYVFLWFVASAQSSGLVPGILGLWTMGNLVAFILYGLFWESVLVGIPAAVAAVVGWQWWKRLPADERLRYRFGRSRSARGGSGVSLLFFIAFCVKVYVDGMWSVAIATFTLNYVVSSMVTILAWGLIVFGIPAVAGLTWWLSRGMKKQS